MVRIESIPRRGRRTYEGRMCVYSSETGGHGLSSNFAPPLLSSARSL
ncbi:BnaA04g24720D [Brassica napus]|uniref:BnaA04g24720D protein n=2 Tax=Brassica TaxID=3705 RepID=A0A078GXY9_BRANA|nr:BnaA04g24720D [Brassica napus]VDD15934.1 unnamed protein product [Brassica rapa]